MKSSLICFMAIASMTTVLLSGCGKSTSAPDTQPSPTPQNASAPAPATTETVPASPVPAPAPATPAPAPTTAAAPASEATSPPAADTQSVVAATSQLTTVAKSQNDQVLSSVGTELADKVNALASASPTDTSLKSKLTSSVQSLAAGKDSTALGSFYEAAKSSSLTPQQTQLAKEVGNLASAYVVQRNFSSLDGAQTDVATIVNSLRKGEITPALPTLQKVAQNANLTQPQKDLIGSIADKYAPGLSKAAGSVQQGLQGLRNLGK